MRFDRIAAVFSAATGHMVMSHSPPAAADLLPPGGGQNRRSFRGSGAGGGAGKKNFLRLSSSLQDLSTYSKLDLEEGGAERVLDQDRSSIPKTNRALLAEAGAASFSKEKSSPRSAALLLSRRKWARVVLCALCLLLLFSLIYASALYIRGFLSQGSSSYYVILDCGSTGTRVYVYESSINQKRPNGALPITLRPLPEDMGKKANPRSGRAYRRMETEPGLDKLVRNETGLRAAMMPLLQWAGKQIPKNAHKRTSIFLYATAGVRRLPSADSEWLLAKAWKILKNSSFNCQRGWVKTITGMEEAYFGWIALNYNMGMLGSLHAKETLGALDLGGSSLQVTFENEEVINDETSLNLSIGSVDHHLSAYSLAGYGLNDAFDKSVVHLLKQLPVDSPDDLKNGKAVVKHPCLQNGYREQYVCSQCTKLSNAGSPTVGGVSAGKGRKGIPVQLVGAPQWEECSALAKITVNLSEWSDLNSGIDCDIRPCALADNVPRPHGHFYAMSGFFVVFRFFNLTSDASLDDMLQKGQEFCEKEWEAAKNSVIPQPFIEQYCFRAPYVASLLRDGLHIRDTEVVIGSGSMTWTLGAALLEAAQAFSKWRTLPNYTLLRGRINPVIVFGLLLVSVAILLCAVSFVSKRLRSYLRRAYLPLFKHNIAGSGFQHWNPINSGDNRSKTPLSPTVSGSEQRPFGLANGSGGESIQLMESSLNPSTTGVLHSYSYSNFGQIYSDNGIGSSWAPHRNQMRLQSRRSQSREDLVSSLSDAHTMKS